MASIWDELDSGGSQPGSTGGSIWDELESGVPSKPAPPASRGLFGAANDYVIEAANAVLSGTKSIIDFASPGTDLAASIQRLVEEGESKQSDVARQAKQELGQALSTDDTMEQLKAVGKYAVTSPGLAISQAVGSFVAPGAAIKAARGGAALFGVGERAAGAARAVGPLRPGVAEAASERALSRAGLGGGAAAGAALAGGDAAGNAYDMVYEGLTNAGVDPEEARRQATVAAREASVVPAAIGGLTGVFGAEARFAGGLGAPKSILRTGLSEAGQEAFEEGATQLSANLAAGQYVNEIPAMRGVVGSAAMGAVLGGITGAGVAAITRQPSSLLGNANDNLDQTNSPDADNLNQAVNKPGQMELFSTDELLSIEEQNRERMAFNPYNVGGFVGQQQAGEDTTMEFTGEGVPAGTQPSLLPTAGPTETIAPAAAPQPQAQTQPAKGTKQAPQVSQEQAVATAQRFGLTPVTGIRAQAWDILGVRLYGQPKVQEFVAELSAADQGKDPQQLAIEKAVIDSNLVRATQPTAKSVIGALAKQLEKLQLNNATSIEEAAEILNDQIQRLAQSGKGASDANVTALAQVYENLTGTEAPAYALTQGGTTNVQQEQQVSAGVGAVPVQSGARETDGGKLGLVRPSLVQPVGTGSVAQRPTGQQAGQLPGEGVRPSPSVTPDTRVSGQQKTQKVTEAPSEVKSIPVEQYLAEGGTADGKGLPATTEKDTGKRAATVPARVQPAGQTDGTTVSQGAATSAEDGRTEATKKKDVGQQVWDSFETGGLTWDSLTEQDQRDFKQLVVGRKGKGITQAEMTQLVTALKDRNAAIQAAKLVNSTLEKVLKQMFPMAKQADKVRYFVLMLGGERVQSVAQTAIAFGKAKDTIKEWNQQLKQLQENPGALLVQARAILAKEKISFQQAQDTLQTLEDVFRMSSEDVDTERQDMGVEAADVGESVVDERELGDVEGELGTKEGRTSLSVSEYGNKKETLNARYARLAESYDEAVAEGNEELAAELQEKIDETLEEISKGKKSAVQKQSTAKVPVRKGTEGGERVGQEVRGTEKPASKTEVAVKEKGEVVLTQAEATQVAYEKLVAMLPEGALPAYGDLTVAQKEALMSIPAEELNMRNLQSLMDESNVIDVEAREVTPEERQLLLTQTSKLNDKDVKTLERQYGAKRGTKEFLSKLNNDVTTFINRGAEFVAENIRAIIQQVAKLAVAAAIVFNPNITGNGFNFNLQEAYAKVHSIDQQVTVPKEAASQMSNEAKIVYQQLAPLAKQQQRGFIIADKKNGKIHFFYSSGQHMASDAALYGKDVGDKFQGDSLKGGKKITPAGKFTLKATKDSEYAGGWRLDLAETSFDGGVIAIHPAWLGNTKEKRLERLASEDAKDNRVSYGCINTTHELFLNKVKPQLGEFDGGMIFVVPDAPLATAQVQFSKRRRRKETKSTVADIKQSIYNFVGAANEERVRVFQSVKDLPLYVRESVKKQTGEKLADTEQAFVYGGRAYLIADNIVPGTERAVFMHEVGYHLGLQKILSSKDRAQLLEQIQKWKEKNDGSLESRLANAAFDRLLAADELLSPNRQNEFIAYFIEEAILAGVNPTALDAKTALGRWFRTVWVAFKTALRKLRLDPEKLSAVDIVNMAYGAAKLETTGTWHGSAAIFQNFRTQYIGSGEGAQAFGWGMYFARSYAIAKDYFERDKQRKAFEAFVDRKKIEQYIAKTQAEIDKALEQVKMFPALNRELNRAVRNPENQSVLFPEGTIITKEVLVELSRLGIDVIEIKGSSLPKTDPDFDPRVSAAEISVIPYKKLPEDSLWLQDYFGTPGLLQSENTVAFFKDWLDANAPEKIEEAYQSSLRSSRPMQKAKFIQDTARTFVKQNPQYNEVIEEFYVAATPAGSIMRVDLTFGVDQTLVWDKPFTEQPSIVQQKLMELPYFKSLPKNILDSATGEDIYKYFATGALGQEYDGALDKDASQKLYKLGVKGISYFDRSSRNIDYFNYERKAELNEIAFEFNIRGGLTLASEIEQNGAESVIDTYGIKGKARNEVLQYEEYIDQARTKNIVAFDESDVKRVFSQIGMENSTGIDRVQFSKKGQATIDKLPAPARSQAQQIWDTITNFAKKGLPAAAFTQDLADLAQKYIPSAKRFFDLTMEQQAKKTEYELRVARILNAYNKLPSSVKGTGPNSVNIFLKDSTSSGKWGYKIDPKSDVEVDPALKARFDAFPKEAQQVIKDVFAHGFQTLQDMKAAVRSNINTEFDALIKDAQEANDDKEVADLQKQKDATLKQYESLLSIAGKRPYAPLKRFGNYVVVGRSQAYMDAEDANDRKLIEKLQKDESHYFVQFAETFAEAKAIEREEAGRYGIVQAFEKDTAAESIYGGRDLQQVFFRLKNLAKDSFDDKTNQTAVRGINKLINDLHLSMLAESSARQAENRRRNIAGADDDMMRAFATQGRATAHFIGSLTNTGQIYETLREMKKEADARAPGRDERRRYYNEFMKRHALGFDYEPSPVLNKALAITSGWMLLTNPAYYLQNMTQPVMMSVPYMAGKHGYSKSNSILFKAYSEVAGLIRGVSVDERFDFSKLPADVRDMMEELVKRGRIDISLEQDLGDWQSAEGGALDGVKKVSTKLRSVAQKVEMINRVATAITAYRLEKLKGAGDLAAINYADKVIRVTHGDYSGANAPRFMRTGIGRLATQFRKFQLIQISMMTRLFNDAFKGATPEERYAAKKALLWTFTHAGVMGGIMGLPGFAAIAVAYGALFGDEDEPEDPELALRRYFGPDFGTLMTKGLPAAMGVDLSGKVGMGQMLSILPYTDLTDLNRSNYEKLVTAAMGPFVGGLVPRAVDGLGYMADGNYYRGMEGLMPAGVAQTLKAYRLATEGVTQRNNDVTLSADEITGLDAMLVALGLPTTKLTEQQFRTRTKIQFEQFFDGRTSDIKKAYAKAYRSNDAVGMAEAREDWKNLQDAKVREGFKRQPLSNLLKAPREQRKRERQTAGGVQFDTASRRFVRELPQ